MARPTEAFVSEKLLEHGFGTVVFTRFRGGNAETGGFFLDLYCLGVKNAVYALVHESEYERRILDRLLGPGERKPMDPPSARKLVEGALNYARSLGFPPDSDYRKAARVFGGTNAADSSATFEFGKDGKPLYVRGQGDPFAKFLRILKQLRNCRGADGFEFLGSCTEEEAAMLELEGIPIRQRFAAPEGKAGAAPLAGEAPQTPRSEGA